MVATNFYTFGWLSRFDVVNTEEREEAEDVMLRVSGLEGDDSLNFFDFCFDAASIDRNGVVLKEVQHLDKSHDRSGYKADRNTTPRTHHKFPFIF